MREKMLILGIFLLLLVSIKATGKSFEDDLRSELLKEYNPLALPAPHTKVNVRLNVLYFNLNEKEQSLDLDLWVAMDWNDQRLKWRKNDYPEISKLSFNKNQIWYPDLTVYNSVGGEVNSIQSTTKILVTSNNGSIMWVPPSHVRAMCIMDMTYWPYDVHNCSIKIGSWVHSMKTIDLGVLDDVVDVELMERTTGGKNITRSEWELIDSEVVRNEVFYDCCPEAYVNIRASMILQRQGKAYWWSVQLPGNVLGTILVATFLVPPGNGEKVIMAAITFFMNYFLLEKVSEKIGHASTHTPLIVELLSIQLTLCGVAIIANAVIFATGKTPKSSRLSSSAKSFVKAISKLLCLKGYREKVETSLASEKFLKNEDLELNDGIRSGAYHPNGKGSACGEWMLVAAVLNRLCLLVFLALFIINTVTYSAVK